MRNGKYNAIPTVIDGIRFDSKAEARRYQQLILLERAGEITGLEIHKRFRLHAGIVYECDFLYEENGKKVAEDVKGMETQAFKIKKKLFRVDHPQIELRIISSGDV